MGCNTSKQRTPLAPQTGGPRTRSSGGEADSKPLKPAPAAKPTEVQKSEPAAKPTEVQKSKPAAPKSAPVEKKEDPPNTEAKKATEQDANLIAPPKQPIDVSAPRTPPAEDEEAKRAKVIYEIGLDGSADAYVVAADGQKKAFTIVNEGAKLVYEITEGFIRNAFIKTPAGDMQSYKHDDSDRPVENLPEGGKFTDMVAADGSKLWMEINGDGSKKAVLLTPDGIRRIFNLMEEETKIVFEIASSGAKHAIIVARDGSQKVYEVALERAANKQGFFDLAGSMKNKFEVIAADGAKIAVETAQNGQKKAYVVAWDGTKKIMNSAKSATKVMYEVAMDGKKKAYFIAEDGGKQMYDFSKAIQRKTNKVQPEKSKTVIFDTKMQTSYTMLDQTLIRERMDASSNASLYQGPKDSPSLSNATASAGQLVKKISNTVASGLENEDVGRVVQGLKKAGSGLLSALTEETTTTTRTTTENVYEDTGEGMKLVGETTTKEVIN